MAQTSQEQMQQLVEQLQLAPGIAEQLPDKEGAMVHGALNGLSVFEIAQQCRTSEAAVWATLGNAARFASGKSSQSVEIGEGLGSEASTSDPGGYGNIGLETPEDKSYDKE